MHMGILMCRGLEDEEVKEGVCVQWVESIYELANMVALCLIFITVGRSTKLCKDNAEATIDVKNERR